jgi:ATP-binding protein involved in chromosome partitioning
MNEMTKAIPVASLKGGVGKSVVTANLGLALRDKGFKIGFLDIDLTGATLPSALEIPEPFPWVGLDTAQEKMLPVTINGYEVFSIAFRFGKAALLWKGGEEKVKAFGQEFELRGTGRFELVRHMLANVQFSDPDYLLVDCPPTAGDETLSLWQYMKYIWGLILVCQPTNLSVQDIERALNMVEAKRLPLLGMVGNMIGTVCPRCGHSFSPFLDGGVDLEDFCRSRGVPFLTSVPLTPNKELLKQVFSELAAKIIQVEPVKIWQRSFKERVIEGATRGIVQGLFS